MRQARAARQASTTEVCATSCCSPRSRNPPGGCGQNVSRACTLTPINAATIGNEHRTNAPDPRRAAPVEFVAFICPGGAPPARRTRDVQALHDLHAPGL